MKKSMLLLKIDGIDGIDGIEGIEGKKVGFCF
jgi:hypothetical protein